VLKDICDFHGIVSLPENIKKWIVEKRSVPTDNEQRRVGLVRVLLKDWRVRDAALALVLGDIPFGVIALPIGSPFAVERRRSDPTASA
jgi:hypothetical protein